MMTRCLEDLETKWGVQPTIRPAEQSKKAKSSRSIDEAEQSEEPCPPDWNMRVCPMEPSPLCYIKDEYSGQFKCLLCMKTSRPAFITWKHMRSTDHQKRSQPTEWRGWLKYNLERFGVALGLDS